MSQIAAAILLIDNKKVGELTEASYSVKANGQLVVTADEVMKTIGKSTAEISFTVAMPVAGLTINIAELAITQQWCVVQFVYAGLNLISQGTFDQTDFSSNIGSGMTDQKPRFSGSVELAPQA